MSAIVVLGLKVPFKKLWVKDHTEERDNCYCPKTSETYVYCPHCGVQKKTRKTTIYKSLLDGSLTACRKINFLKKYLNDNNLEIYDYNPDGYYDDPVYIYIKNPSCYMRITANSFSKLDMRKGCPEVEEELYELLGDNVWKNGSFGLWAFMIKESEHDTPDTSEESSSEDEDYQPIVVK